MSPNKYVKLNKISVKINLVEMAQAWYGSDGPFLNRQKRCYQHLAESEREGTQLLLPMGHGACPASLTTFCGTA